MRLMLIIILALLITGCGVIATRTPLSSSSPTGDLARGELIFRKGVNHSPPCISCHALAKGAFSLGPVMQGISGRAGDRIAGMDVAAYLRQSILNPTAFVVPGYRGIMYPKYADHFSDGDITDLIAFLMTQ